MAPKVCIRLFRLKDVRITTELLIVAHSDHSCPTIFSTRLSDALRPRLPAMNEVRSETTGSFSHDFA